MVYPDATNRVQPKEVTILQVQELNFILLILQVHLQLLSSGSTTALNSQLQRMKPLKVYGYVGDTTISYATGATSKDIAEAITAQSGITGVTAYAETNVRLTVTPDQIHQAPPLLILN